MSWAGDADESAHRTVGNNHASNNIVDPIFFLTVVFDAPLVTKKRQFTYCAHEPGGHSREDKKAFVSEDRNFVIACMH